MGVDPQEWLRNKQQGKSTGDIDPQQWLKQRIELESKKEAKAQPVDVTEPTWGDVVKNAVANFPASAASAAKGVGETVLHPIDTAQNLLDAANGGLQKVLPDSVNEYMHKIAPETKGNQAKADIIGEFYKQRYGSEAGFKDALANDPAGVLMDASTVFGVGGGIASKAGMNGKMLVDAGRKIDPLLNTAKLAKWGVEKTGAGLANVIGGAATHTGAESLKAAARAGLEGGTKEADFVDNMRGMANAEDMLPELKSALSNMRQQRGETYRQGMANVAQDKQVIPMVNIKAAIDKSMNIKNFKGESTSPSTQALQSEILDQYDRWSNLDPAEYHTAEGLDAFKQIIGDIRDNTQPNTPQRAVAKNVYDAVKKEIVNQAPEYAKVMADYEKASKLTGEIEKSLSLGEKASADTALRKLQSLTRNNVNTNYGNRLKLAKELEQNGADNLSEKLAGQALNTWTPRGLGGIAAMGTGSYGLYAHNPTAIPLLAIQSPRLMGEAALLAGKTARYAGKGGELVKDTALSLGISPEDLTKIIYQARDRSK